jgi:hypothetical protein
VYENLVIVALIGLGAALMRRWILLGVPVLSVAYLLMCAVMMGYVLRRQLCSRCVYYDQWCHCGWGKLAALVVRRSSDSGPTPGKLAPMFWITVMFLPLVAAGLSLAFALTTWRQELLYLVGFVVTLVLSMEMHLRDCKTCKMRHSCPGSAARSNA